MSRIVASRVQKVFQTTDKAQSRDCRQGGPVARHAESPGLSRPFPEEESIYLADRIVVMTYRPGTIKRDQRVLLPRPRDPAAAGFNELKRELGLLVMEEQQRHADEERHAAVD